MRERKGKVRVLNWLCLVLDLLARLEKSVLEIVLSAKGETVYAIPDLAR